MNDPKIVASTKGRGVDRGSMSSDAARSWRMLGWIGLAFLTVGGADFVLTWLPVSFGNREWEFGTVTQSFNALPIVFFGIGIVMAAGERAGRDWWIGVATGVAAILLVWVLVGVGLWLISVPLAFATVPDNLALGLQKAAAKTALQALIYPAVLLYLLRRAWLGRNSRAQRAEEK